MSIIEDEVTKYFKFLLSMEASKSISRLGSLIDKEDSDDIVTKDTSPIYKYFRERDEKRPTRGKSYSPQYRSLAPPLTHYFFAPHIIYVM